jgi:CubicO group peptidase (beta-lactamase class C family)
MLVAQGSAVAAPAESPWPTRDWTASTPEAQGVDSAALASLVEFGAAGGMDSLLVVRRGHVVLETYWAPFRPGMRHAVHSATKAVVGTLVGIAVQQGLLPDTAEPVVKLLADLAPSEPDERKRAITVQHLLDMTSGLAWEEPLKGAPKSAIAMERSADWARFVLEQPMARAPGEAFDYNSGNSHLLSALLGRASGGSARAFAEQALFGPLGIRDVAWRHDPQGVTIGGYGLYLQPRDMARLGALLLRDGVWEGRRLLPRGWVDSIRGSLIDMRLSAPTPFRYANGWWVMPEYGAFLAAGHHRQLIVVMPALDLVAVTTGRANFSFIDLMKGLRAAARSPVPLPPNEPAEAALARRVEAAAVEPRVAVRPPPQAARALSGRTIRLEPNTLGIRSLRLDLTGEEGRYDLVLEPLRAGLPPRRFSGPIGLDGMFRTGDAAGGTTAARGTWTADDRFVALFRFVPEGRSSTYTLTLGERGVEVLFENAFGEQTRLREER